MYGRSFSSSQPLAVLSGNRFKVFAEPAHDNMGIWVRSVSGLFDGISALPTTSKILEAGFLCAQFFLPLVRVRVLALVLALLFLLVLVLVRVLLFPLDCAC